MQHFIHYLLSFGLLLVLSIAGTSDIPSHMRSSLSHGIQKLKEVHINNRPIIGILTQPSEWDNYPLSNYSYIAASYIKFVEGCGARAVPLRWDLPPDVMTHKFNSLNGIVFPGGGNNHLDPQGHFTKLVLAHKFLIQLAQQANDNGTYYPIWSVCMGYEFMMIVYANDASVLSPGYNDTHQNLNQLFTPAAGTSRLLVNLPSWMSTSMQTEPVLLFNHEYGVKPSVFANTPALSDAFNVLSTSWDESGTEFLAMVEHKTYPFYGVQFHPEKSIYEWTVAANASHVTESILIVQYFGNFLNFEARKNLNSFSDPDEEYNSLIFSYTPVQFHDPDFVQIYFFENCNVTDCTKTTKGSVNHSISSKR